MRDGRDSKREPRKKKRGRDCRLRGGLVPPQGRQTRPRQPLSPIGGNGASVRPMQEPEKGNGVEEPERPRQPKSDDETSKRFCKGMLKQQTNEKHSGGEAGPRTRLRAVAPFRGEPGPLATP